MSDRRDDVRTYHKSPDPRRLDPRPISAFTDSASSLPSRSRQPTAPKGEVLVRSPE